MRSIVVPLVALGIAGCASAPPQSAAQTGPYWSYSRAVDADDSLLTLFDPDDLAHHANDPADWYRYDFAYANDLAAGRFVAVLTGDQSVKRVRVTDAPLSDAELAVAGTSATLRLRVRQDRILLSGGNAWPSSSAPRMPGPRDPRWLHVPNGDYRVTATVLDAGVNALHDYVFRFEPVESIESIAYAPGVPQLLVGDARPAVAGVDARGSRFVERCSAVPDTAEFSPLIDRSLPLPGSREAVAVSRELHDRGVALHERGHPANLPLVVTREPRVGAFGVFMETGRWLPVERDRYGRERFTVSGQVACAVRITSIDSSGVGFQLGIEPLPGAQGRLSTDLATELVDSFDTWLRMSGDRAWRFKSASVRRAPDARSLVYGVMQQVGLSPDRTEALLQLDSESRARALIEQLRDEAI